MGAQPGGVRDILLQKTSEQTNCTEKYCKSFYCLSLNRIIEHYFNRRYTIETVRYYLCQIVLAKLLKLFNE